MLSNLIVTSTQRLVLIIDELGQEKIANKFLCQLLREQGQQESTIKSLPFSAALKFEKTFEDFVSSCKDKSQPLDNKHNVLLPTLADMLCYQRPAVIFQFLHKLRKCSQIKQIFVWASPQFLVHAEAVYLVAACEYMANLILHIESVNELGIVTRKPGGGITNKRYSYVRSKSEFMVQPLIKEEKSKITENITSSETMGGTFKIELDEEELVARNALKMPYEKTSETTEGSIIYTPDAQDDFDEEDPDEDLCI